MKKGGKYRFSLQFGSDTEEQIRAGDLLERLGNKKSHIIVAALNSYIDLHPELTGDDSIIKVEVRKSYDRDTIEKLVLEIIDKRYGYDGTIHHGLINESAIDDKISIEDDISAMLDNISVFS